MGPSCEENLPARCNWASVDSAVGALQDHDSLAIATCDPRSEARAGLDSRLCALLVCQFVATVIVAVPSREQFSCTVLSRFIMRCSSLETLNSQTPGRI